MTSGFSKLTQRQREQLLILATHPPVSKMACKAVKLNLGLDSKFVPQNFLPLVAKAMSVLYAGQKYNLIYNAA
jgi:hypothetical protein